MAHAIRDGVILIATAMTAARSLAAAFAAVTGRWIEALVRNGAFLTCSQSCLLFPRARWFAVEDQA